MNLAHPRCKDLLDRLSNSHFSLSTLTTPPLPPSPINLEDLVAGVRLFPTPRLPRTCNTQLDRSTTDSTFWTKLKKSFVQKDVWWLSDFVNIFSTWIIFKCILPVYGKANRSVTVSAQLQLQLKKIFLSLPRVFFSLRGRGKGVVKVKRRKWEVSCRNSIFVLQKWTSHIDFSS